MTGYSVRPLAEQTVTNRCRSPACGWHVPGQMPRDDEVRWAQLTRSAKGVLSRCAHCQLSHAPTESRGANCWRWALITLRPHYCCTLLQRHKQLWVQRHIQRHKQPTLLQRHKQLYPAAVPQTVVGTAQQTTYPTASPQTAVPC